MLIAFAWIASILGLALAVLVPFAAGMKTVGHLSGSEASIAVPLPLLAILLAGAYLMRHVDGGRGITLLVGGIPIVLSLGGLGLLGMAYVFQPHPSGPARTIRRLLQPPRPVRLDFYRAFQHGAHTVRVANIPGASPQQTEVPERVGDTVFTQTNIRAGGAAIEAAYAIACEHDGEKAIAFVGGSGSYTSPTEACLVVRDDRCIVALGRDLVCLALPDLRGLWRRPLDSVAMNVYLSADEIFLVAHDAMTVSRVDFEGNVAWTFTGKGDPLTRDLTIEADELTIVDCYGVAFRVALEDGRELARIEQP